MQEIIAQRSHEEQAYMAIERSHHALEIIALSRRGKVLPDETEKTIRTTTATLLEQLPKHVDGVVFPASVLGEETVVFRDQTGRDPDDTKEIWELWHVDQLVTEMAQTALGPQIHRLRVFYSPEEREERRDFLRNND